MNLPRLSLIALTALATLACAARPDAERLREQVAARIAESGAETVGFYFADLHAGDSVLVNADARMHAASMMKVPVMIQLFRDAAAGRLNLDDSIPITKTFRSIVDGSPYDLAAPDDSDSTLYNRVGEREAIRHLMERMITVSSNLATNILIELV
ncbi:MAG: serine hydrolase, partial [Gemmatimonadales bacterium]